MTCRDAPVWLPDWSDDSAYPSKFDEWSLGQWAWAFLRRNAEYQTDYAHFSALPDFFDGGGKTPKWAGRSMADFWAMDFRYCDPPALPGELSRDYWKRNEGKVIEEMDLESHLMLKWKILQLPDPADEDGWKIVSFDIDMPPFLITLDAPRVELGWTPPPPEPDRIENVTLRFDVRLNIEKQLEEAKVILKDTLEMRIESLNRIRSATPSKEKLPNYLRAYDADVVGVGPRELARKICPHKSNSPASVRSADEEARRAIKTAKGLVDMGYVELLMFG